MRATHKPAFRLLKGSILRFFALQGRHVAPMGEIFRLLHAKFHPIGAGVRACEPAPKLIFNAILKYKLQGRISCAIFTKLSCFVGSFSLR